MKTLLSLVVVWLLAFVIGGIGIFIGDMISPFGDRDTAKELADKAYWWACGSTTMFWGMKQR